MYLSELQERAKEFDTDLREWRRDPEHPGVREDLDAITRDALRAIATGQCRDLPPEEFAAVALEAVKALRLARQRWHRAAVKAKAAFVAQQATRAWWEAPPTPRER